MLALSVERHALYKYPEWYVIDALGILLAAGVASIFGVSLGTVPVIVLLVILAVYDAISVYKTKHMITLAEGVIDLKTPILFVIPKKRDYSFIQEGIGKLDDGGERSAFIMGMGDLIMPSVLVVSANVFSGGVIFRGRQPPGTGCDHWLDRRACSPALFRHVRTPAGRSPAPKRRDYSRVSYRLGALGFA